MIDTITLRLNESDFKIVDHNRFMPNSYNFFYPPYSKMGNRGYIDAFQNPTKSELKAGSYRPQLTLRKRWRNSKPMIFLYIQFSAPKILYGNNFDELVDSDLEKLFSALKSSLFDMGVVLEKRDLHEARVIKIHYAKNIVLPDFIIPSMIIGELRKIDFNFHKELTERDYRNSGQSIRFHANDFELIIYDKKQELKEKSYGDSRLIEMNDLIQPSLFEKIKRKKLFEVLRIEARLNTSNSIRSETGIPKKNHTLASLFSSQLSTNLLRRYWKALTQSYRLLSYDIDDKEKFLASFIINNPDAKLSNALSTHALIDFVKHMGICKFRNLIEKKFTRRSWYSLKANLKRYNIDISLPNHFNSIANSLNTYEPLILDNYLNSI